MNDARVTQGGQSFEEDIARIAKIRRMCDFRIEPYEVGFLVGFIDRLWREYSRSNDEIERLKNNFQFLRGLVEERNKGSGDLPVWLALEWIDDLAKSPTRHPSEVPHD